MGNSSSGKIDVLIMAAMMIVVVSAISALMNQTSKPKYGFNVHNSMKVIKQNLYLHMDDPVGWQFTIDENAANYPGSNLALVKNHLSLTGLDGTKSVVYLVKDVANNDYLTDLDKPTQGIGLDGKSCTTYDDVNGNPGCPIKVDIKWQPTCGAIPGCIDPPYIVEVKFKYRIPLGYGPNIDVSKYDFVLSKP